ncbi:hypothetical protein OAN38_03910 [Candidatus Marinimicrobia bacterium]|nr:hypothetical protein [Candidatus Neomarinimicrobiota bacterium]MDC0383971.1 hypothetical protein [Candidatus Neomarinimicrobiota bacterium]
MNSIQKIFLMVSVGSMIILLISATSLGFNPFGTLIDSTNVDISTEKYQEDTGVKVTDRNFNINDYKGWVDRQKRKNGTYKRNIDLARIFRNYEASNNKLETNINYLGIIAFSNIFVCLTGYLLFKSKK